MVVEIVAGVLASSLALLSDAAHMLTDALALAVALAAARLAVRPPRGVMTYGLGRVEILSAQANGVTLLVLSVVIVIDAVQRLVSPPSVDALPMLVVALVGIPVNLAAARILAGGCPSAASTSRAPTATSSPTCTASSPPPWPPASSSPPGLTGPTPSPR